MEELDGVAIERSGKASFARIYSLPDPREYFRVLCGLDYVIPDLAKGIFRSLIRNLGQAKGDQPIRVLDVGCSYGINAALVEYPLDIRRLARRYAATEIQALRWEQLILLDRHYFSAWPKRTNTIFVGVDTSVPAVSYATAVGLINGGVTSDLERDRPTTTERDILSGADLIISTGCVGYVSHRTFHRILKCQGNKPPIVAAFVLRMFSYDEIADEMSNFGLVTERLEGVTFVQRRFASAEEFRGTINKLGVRDIDPAGKEADGLLHAELFVSRPRELVEETPLANLFSVTSGQNIPFGRRFRLGSDRESALLV